MFSYTTAHHLNNGHFSLCHNYIFHDDMLSLKFYFIFRVLQGQREQRNREMNRIWMYDVQATKNE